MTQPRYRLGVDVGGTHTDLVLLDTTTGTIPMRATLPNLRSAAIWTHPVVANGRLYLRDQELIFCYEVSAKAAKAPGANK